MAKATFSMGKKKLVAQIHRRQRVRHVVANKIQLALTILKELESERAVEPRLMKRAIRDLEEIVRALGGTQAR